MSRVLPATRLATAVCAAAMLVAMLPSQAAAQSIVEKIKQRGYVSCGASQGVPGLSRPDEAGVWKGMDSDICRALAVAVLGDKDKIRFVPMNAAQRLPGIQTGEIDALSRTTTITYTRDAAVRFVAATLYDTDAFVVPVAQNIKQLKDLDGKTVCLQGGGSLTEQSLFDMMEAEKIKMRTVYFDSTIQARDAYFGGRCDSYITDGMAAAGQRATVARNPADHALLFTGHTEPNGVAIPRGDDRWFDIARWSINVLIWAEDHGVTQANVDQKQRSGSAEERRVLGEAGFGRPIGLDDKWAYNIIKQLGNYKEMWDRNLGDGSPLKLERGLNALYRQGGLMFPYPFD